jgi:hypothetical protein
LISSFRAQNKEKRTVNNLRSVLSLEPVCPGSRGRLPPALQRGNAGAGRKPTRIRMKALWTLKKATLAHAEVCPET